ncbi:pentapeptide repeat-containing protein [uncultured Cocleimonas sp.]|uniref:pentapeptide repeat-containing protein n=1 Tax=uncultured Cocleimonas sp. TaxID=1051587 RepID=UPI00260B59B1|nr:pentapeptide repeat-containing protein [uncultured Cocleimonas sp.]
MCTYEGCNFEKFESQDKCIFHCSKEDWLTPSRRIWQKGKVNRFWEELRNNKQQIRNQFIGFVFPCFEEYPCELTQSGSAYTTRDHSCIFNTNFGIHGGNISNYYSIIERDTSFKFSIFLDIADFSKINFNNQHVNFERSTFNKEFKVSSFHFKNLNFNGALFKLKTNFEELQIINCSFDKTTFLSDVSFAKSNFDNLTCVDSVFEGKALFNDVSVSGSSYFSRVIFKKEANFEFGSFAGLANFEEAQFSSDAKFTQREFKGDADFSSGMMIKGKAYFDVNNMAGKADFSEATFKDFFLFKDVNVKGETNFSHTTFYKDADFQSGSFETTALFSQALFHKNALFTQREFKGDADFSAGVTVKDKALFDVNDIVGKVDFSEATFEDSFTFREVSVVGEAHFSNTKFNKDVDFQNGSFENSAIFSHSQFGGNADFTQREFKGDADFSSGIAIKGKALFDVNNIAGKADFSEATFEDSFTFREVSVVGEAHFSNTKFNKDADFQNGSFENNAIFSHSQFGGNADFTQREFKGDADFSSGITIKGKALFDVNNIAGKADFSKAIFEDDFSFKDVNVTSETSFAHTIFHKEADFKKGKLEGRVNFNCAQFGGNVIFAQREFLNDAHFRKIVIDGSADFSNNTFSQQADFSESKFKSDLNFSSSSFCLISSFKHILSQNIDFSDTNFRKSDLMENNGYLQFLESDCADINFSDSQIACDLSFINSKFKKLDLSNFNIKRESEVEFRDISINHLIFNKYKNESETVLFDFVSVTDNLDIKHVSFDKERFNHFDISKPNIEIENSAFNTNFFNSVKWGLISDKRYTATRDIFRQLKFYSEQQKNYIDADGFYSLEMKEQKKELLKEKKNLSTFSEKIQHYSDIAVFNLHEITSNYSQSWMMPLFWLMVVGVLGVILQNLEKFPVKESVLLLGGYILFMRISTWAYKYVEQKKIIRPIYLAMFIAPLLFAYFYISKDRFDDIAIILNPLNIFKNQGFSDSKEFISLFFKIIVLFLVYQIIASIKKKVRSK